MGWSSSNCYQGSCKLWGVPSLGLSPSLQGSPHGWQQDAVNTHGTDRKARTWLFQGDLKTKTVCADLLQATTQAGGVSAPPSCPQNLSFLLTAVPGSQDLEKHWKRCPKSDLLQVETKKDLLRIWRKTRSMQKVQKGHMKVSIKCSPQLYCHGTRSSTSSCFLN